MKGAGIVEELPYFGGSAKLRRIGSATDKDRTGRNIRLIVPFVNFNNPNVVTLNCEWIKFTVDCRLNGIQRILDRRALGVVNGETLCWTLAAFTLVACPSCR